MSKARELSELGDKITVDGSGNSSFDGDVSAVNLSASGNITVTGTVDGRDVAADGTKLDGIEAGATADQTAAEIKTAYESNADTNAYTDAEKSKLAGVAAGAEVNTVDSVNAQTGAVVLDADDISDATTTNKFTTAADISKLAGIEAGATADQTAAEILTAIKTVDGAGSGLDADVLDGQQGSYYLDANNFVNMPAGYTGWTVSDGTNSESITDGSSVTFAATGTASVSYNTTTNTLTVGATDTNTTYSAGTGLSLSGTTFNNTAPDQTVTLTGSGATSISGTYPNFTISSTDTNTTYSAGGGLSLSGTTFSHSDTSSQGSVNNSGNTFIQDITLDGYGHITGLVSATASASVPTGLNEVGTYRNALAWTQVTIGSTTAGSNLGDHSYSWIFYQSFQVALQNRNASMPGTWRLMHHHNVQTGSSNPAALWVRIS